ncbi:MAG TPA: acyl-CoA thioesterase, partial [Acidimicrobiia bacterium]|nr:acyl-CoA thioesterase [Acidimicrobiia bacterium]
MSCQVFIEARVASDRLSRGEGLGVELPTDREVHVSSVKVRFYELDPYDHVNHTNYFSYFETARIDYLTEMGWGLD